MRKKKQTAVKEKCSKCGSDQFAISQDMRQTRYCDDCKHVWLPKSAVELELDNAKDKIAYLENKIKTLESEQQIPKTEKAPEPQNPISTESLKGEDLFG